MGMISEYTDAAIQVESNGDYKILVEDVEVKSGNIEEDEEVPMKVRLERKLEELRTLDEPNEGK